MIIKITLVDFFVYIVYEFILFFFLQIFTLMSYRILWTRVSLMLVKINFFSLAIDRSKKRNKNHKWINEFARIDQNLFELCHMHSAQRFDNINPNDFNSVILIRIKNLIFMLSFSFWCGSNTFFVSHPNYIQMHA